MSRCPTGSSLACVWWQGLHAVTRRPWRLVMASIGDRRRRRLAVPSPAHGCCRCCQFSRVQCAIQMMVHRNGRGTRKSENDDARTESRYHLFSQSKLLKLYRSFVLLFFYSLVEIGIVATASWTVGLGVRQVTNRRRTCLYIYVATGHKRGRRRQQLRFELEEHKEEGDDVEMPHRVRTLGLAIVWKNRSWMRTPAGGRRRGRHAVHSLTHVYRYCKFSRA